MTINRHLALALGALTGLLGLLAMVRLVAGAFTGGLSAFAWVVTLLAMVPWVAYVAVRARHGRMDLRSALVVLIIDLVGLVVLWLGVVGPVLALAGSLAAFVVIWVKDWPVPRPRTEERFVRIEELAVDDRD
jgi:hypothetical protein